MNAFYFYLLILIHPYLSFWWKSFEQADRKSWEALVPGYNYFIAFKISCQKPWWAVLMLFPGVHLVMLASLNTSYIRKFGYYSWSDTIQGIFFPYLIFAKIAKNNDKALPETNWANGKEVHDRSMGDHIALFLALPIIGHAVSFIFNAISREKPGKKTKVKEWGDSIIFALVAASVIRTYVFEPFQIPTGSMEKTLLVGDFLFVNKLAYGPKVPVTPLSFPLVHNNIPYVNFKSYSYLETLNYTRLPGFGKVKRNDVVVFNYPSGDTAILDPRVPDGLMGHDYHGIVIREAKRIFSETKYKSNYNVIAANFYDSIIRSNPQNQYNLDALRKYSQNYASEVIINNKAIEFINELEKWKSKARTTIAIDKITLDNNLEFIKHGGIIYRPVDKRENYIKRCVGLPGDWLEIKNSKLYINNKPAFVAEFQNIEYIAYNYTPRDSSIMKDRYGLEKDRGDYSPIDDSSYVLNLTKSQYKQIKKDNPNVKFLIKSIPQYSDSSTSLPSGIQMITNLECFPKDPYVNNTITDFTKFQIPFKGQTIKISPKNIAWYRRIITAYEGHTLRETKNAIYIDGQKVTTYTFAMNYYWLMGDNRYKSADSRIWGFVPEDHVVGKASLVWFSKSVNYGIRWERLFNIIH
ncbi:MAG: signal peptidase I [Flavobacteriia bacterium]|nr:signal peptidase I [Flavobacteriia bacterium]